MGHPRLRAGLESSPPEHPKCICSPGFSLGYAHCTRSPGFSLCYNLDCLDHRPKSALRASGTG